MNSSQMHSTTLPPLDHLVKPGQVHSIAAIPDNQKDKYFQFTKQAWEKISKLRDQRDHPEYIEAHTNLTKISNQIKQMMTKSKQEAASAAAAAAAAAPRANDLQSPYSERIMNIVRNLQIVAPPQFWNRPQDGQAWIQEAKLKYANHLQKLEAAENMIRQVNMSIQKRQQAANPLTPEESQNAQKKLAQCNQQIKDAKDALLNFDHTQDQMKAKKQQLMNEGAAQRAQPAGVLGNVTSTMTTQPQEVSGLRLNTSQSSTTDLQAPPTVANPSLEPSRPQANQTTRPPMSVAATTSSGPTSTVQNHNSQPQMNSNSMQTPQSAQGAVSSMSLGATNGPNSQADQSPHVPQTPATSQNAQPQSATSQVPHPLSHKDAVNKAARSYSQPTVPQSTPQSAHPHPQIGSRDQQNANAKWNIPKTLNVTPLQPVPMGPSRPTLSGGPSTGAIGQMGQPGIQKHPGYVLEGEGERVLSKKKLEELVRQVTGGGDGEAGESLDPDVEETLLDVADEFVDNVILAACRLAKLRQSSTLELRDIQLILERNYNIRVPGYASDELRTVKKTQPTQAWTQKMSAVQAAKVTGGKADP